METNKLNSSSYRALFSLMKYWASALFLLICGLNTEAVEVPLKIGEGGDGGPNNPIGQLYGDSLLCFKKGEDIVLIFAAIPDPTVYTTKEERENFSLNPLGNKKIKLVLYKLDLFWDNVEDCNPYYKKSKDIVWTKLENITDLGAKNEEGYELFSVILNIPDDINRPKNNIYLFNLELQDLDEPDLIKKKRTFSAPFKVCVTNKDCESPPCVLSKVLVSPLAGLDFSNTFEQKFSPFAGIGISLENCNVQLEGEILLYVQRFEIPTIDPANTIALEPYSLLYTEFNPHVRFFLSSRINMGIGGGGLFQIGNLGEDPLDLIEEGRFFDRDRVTYQAFVDLRFGPNRGLNFGTRYTLRFPSSGNLLFDGNYNSLKIYVQWR